ncbi:hypothetical protein WNY78_14890 [Psychroserpens sp. AS72]|uniref:hypothetical protein n=1 Tax=Psychroserpens sp. AS72 TaxID=3135775 RepID=UPI00316E10FF
MKLILTTVVAFVITFQSYGQNSFIQIESNKTLDLFNFLETSSGHVGTSKSFQKYISDSLSHDKEFNMLIDSYSKLRLHYSIEQQEFPDKRTASIPIKNLLWIAASNANSIDDFSQRIIGTLPHKTHIQLVKALKVAEPYYNDLIWKKEQDNIARIQNQLSNYKEQISETYLKISKFYNTPWNTDIPFKIMLYPIPLTAGNTTAYQKGNALICGFMSHNENEYKAQLGIIIHEMCHLLYREQSAEFQHKIEQWFTNSTSPYAPLAYTFFDEALASALGNGWAYKQIHKSLDPKEWYNNKHIDGFAHALYPIVEQYVNSGKNIDQYFVNTSIELFEKKFPKATVETAILMNSLVIYANSEKETEIDDILDTIYNYFNIRSMWLSTPILSDNSKKKFDKKETTKLFVIDLDNANTVKGLQEHFPHLKIQTPLNSIDILKDEKTSSTLIIINIDDLAKLNDAYKVLFNITYLENGMNYKIK